MSQELLPNVCRLCLGHDVQLFSLHDPVLTKKIMDCTSLEVQENDTLPQSICKNCLGVVEFNHQFRKQCLKADEILRNCTYGYDALTLRNLLEDSITLEENTGNVKAEVDFINNSDIKEERHIKPEIDECISNCSDIDDKYDDYGTEDTVDDTKFMLGLSMEKSSKIKKGKEKKSKSIKRKENKNMEIKIKRTKSKESKEKKCSNRILVSNTIIKRTRKLKNMTVKCFQCDYCGKTFKKSQHFRNHTRIHTGEKPYACEVCPKVFTLKHQLQTHSRTHTRERPFPCKFCGARFLDHSARNRHQKIHTNDKKHPCTHCEKRFMTKYDLNKHVARHTGSKFYECTVCFQSYADASSLTKHKKVHIGDVKELTKIKLD